jgi:hypothetical protein
VFRGRLVLYGTDCMPVLQHRSMGHRTRLGLRLRNVHHQRIDEPSLAVPERTGLHRRAGYVYG